MWAVGLHLDLDATKGGDFGMTGSHGDYPHTVGPRSNVVESLLPIYEDKEL